MIKVQPFKALRPQKSLAEKICAPPYDVMSVEEARDMARDNPLSFLRVSRPELELPDQTDPYSEEVYQRASVNFKRLIDEGHLVVDDKPHYYLYRQKMGKHVQTGLVAVASCEDYEKGLIKKHEFTRPDKEDDRVRHIESLESQTGPVFLVYRSEGSLDVLFETASSRQPEIRITTTDGVEHTVWVIEADSELASWQAELDRLPCLYIADGHHRSAAAARVWQSRQGSGESPWFLSVIFPHDQLQVLAYNRIVRDLNGLSVDEFVNRLKPVFEIREGVTTGEPEKAREVGIYMDGKWMIGRFRSELLRTGEPQDLLDVALLQRYVLSPLLGIEDPRRSSRIQFVGGIRGVSALTQKVDSGEFACAFSMFPTSMEDLMEVADKGGIMPPKSTWFEPKLRDGLFCHNI